MAETAGNKTLVGVVMGSKSDWDVMQHASKTLDDLGITHDVQVLSAHRTPEAAHEFAVGLEKRGVEVLIAAAGGAAHLAGVMAANTSIPVLGVPMHSASLGGMDSLLSTAQMPAGIPVGTLAIGKPGAINAALLASAILGNKYEDVKTALKKFRVAQTQQVLSIGDPRKG